MTTTTFLRAALALVSLGLVACGGDGKKTRQSCDVDNDCSGGVCFEQQCYTACTDQSTCAGDEFCVAKPRGDETVNLCVVAADFAPCTSVDECSELVPSQCQTVACGADGVCGFDKKLDGTYCDGPDRPGFCQVGTCITGDTCPNGACTAGETCENCPEDCCNPDPCGDGLCNADGGETCASCVADCGCPADERCGDDGTCVGCVPDCAGRQCGPDSCGGSCGECTTGQECDAESGRCGGGGGECGDGTCGASEDCVTCPGDCEGCVAGYLWTFDDDVTTGFSSDISADPWQAPVGIKVVEGGPSFLGPFGKQTVHLRLGSPGTTAATGGLPLGLLPAHDTVRLTFDLYVLGSWDGHAATDGSTYQSMPDTWTWGVPEIEEGNSYSFSNCPEDVQTWPEPFTAGIPNATKPAKNGAASTATVISTTDTCGDATYHVTFTFAHHTGTIDVVFLGNPNEYLGSQDLANESWGLDNVKIELLCAACGS